LTFELSFCRQLQGSAKLNHFMVSDARKNRLELYLPEKLLKKYENLTFVTLNFKKSNHIYAGIEETFKNLKSLIVLHEIKFVERQNFEHLENLEVLSLDNNQIEHLTEDVFWDLTNLESLLLQSNRIEVLPEKVFMNLRNIEWIDLNNNRIKHFPSNLLLNNQNLRIFGTNGSPGNKSNIDISGKHKIYGL
jgi:Leucine-rich repeat (LRR) protein